MHTQTAPLCCPTGRWLRTHTWYAPLGVAGARGASRQGKLYLQCGVPLARAGGARTPEARGGRNLKNGCDVDQLAGAVAAPSAADDHSAAPDEGLAAGQSLGPGPPRAHAQHLSTAVANWPVGEGTPLAAGARGTSRRREYPPAGQRTAGTRWCRQHARSGRNHKNGAPSPAGRCCGWRSTAPRAVTAWPLAILPDRVRSRGIRPTSLAS
jgi:hypothetical protein